MPNDRGLEKSPVCQPPVWDAGFLPRRPQVKFREGSHSRSGGLAGQQLALRQPRMRVFIFVGATQPGSAAQLPPVLQPTITEANSSISTVGHQATEGGQLSKTPFLLAAMPDFPLNNHCSLLSDLGFEWRGPIPSSRDVTPSRPDADASGHPTPLATRMDGFRDGH